MTMRVKPSILSILTLVATLSGEVTLAAPPAMGLAAMKELPDLVEKVLPGVVNISSTTVTNVQVSGMEDFMQFFGIPREYTQSSLGSGLLIDTEGTILTNHHVVDHATEVMVTLMDKREFRARIVGRDPKLDIAVLRIRDKAGKIPANLSPVPMGNSDVVRIAEPVFAVGNPMGLSHSVTMGIISAKNRTIGLGPFDNFLQTDASINPGNSGGPLFSLKGEVIGINTVIFSNTRQSAGLGFAIPSNEVKRVLADLIKYGRVPRPWLGVLGQGLTPALVAHYRIPVKKGVLVYNLVRGGPADRSGVEVGDIVLGINESDVSEPHELERKLADFKPKDAAKIRINRDGKTQTLHLKLEELPARIDNLPQGII